MLILACDTMATFTNLRVWGRRRRETINNLELLRVTRRLDLDLRLSSSGPDETASAAVLSWSAFKLRMHNSNAGFCPVLRYAPEPRPSYQNKFILQVLAPSHLKRPHLILTPFATFSRCFSTRIATPSLRVRFCLRLSTHTNITRSAGICFRTTRYACIQGGRKEGT